MDTEKGNIIFGAVVVLVLIFSGIFLSYYYKLIPENIFTKKNSVEDLKEFYDMRIICPVGAEFKLKYKNLDLITGEMNENSIEKVENLIMGREYTLSCWDDDGLGADYYVDYVTCVNQTNCKLELDKQGIISTDITRYLNYIDYKVYVTEGTINKPILCFAWEGLYDLEANLTKHPIIERLSSYVDKCYALDGETSAPITYREIEGENSKIKFYIIDKCFGGYGDCGIEDYIEELKV